VPKIVSGENHDGWPYKKLEHWPPMTYRNRSTISSETNNAFMGLLETENNSRHNMELQPWIPFCEGRCTFCYFPVNCDKQNINLYIEALKKALSFYAESPYVKSSNFSEFYIGGGSPSVLTKNQIEEILRFCREAFSFTSNFTTKFTACTHNLTEEKIRLFSSNEVNQLDIGIQTFDEELRKVLMLRDSGKNAKQKLIDAKNHGLNVSIDLLYNLPGQSIEQWKEDLRQSVELNLESVDCYPLELYPDTPLSNRIAKGELPPANGDAKELEMYLEAYRFFKENGYAPTCHNRFSRLREDFDKPSSEVIGTGAGFFMGRLGRYLYSDIENVEEYIAKVQNGGLPIARLAKLSLEDEMRTAMMLIYVRVPVDREEFKAQFGRFPEEAFPDAIDKLQRNGLIKVEDGKIRLTEKGDPWRFNIAWEFFENKSQN
jgi:coproporphyrinogen III oxidase-like Fe-S oxidoreductase